MKLSSESTRKDKKPDLIVFTDGASRGNPGPGGYGAIIINTKIGEIIELGGSKTRTTNNEMELMAVVGALSYLMQNTLDVEMYTDSRYVMNGAEKWRHAWKKNNWCKKDGSPILNLEIWKQLDMLLTQRESLTKVIWRHVPGHAGITGNEQADQIATEYADGKNIQLFRGNIEDYKYKDTILYIPESIFIRPEKEGSKKRGSADFSKELKEKSEFSKTQKAYCYLSLVNGEVQRHVSWKECESRVKGVAKAKFRKAFSEDHVQEILAEEWKII